MNSAFHIIINEIRKKYAGKKASMLDVYDIESTYKISSFMNIRNDNCAFLRITSFGLDEIVFEDIVTNLAFIKPFNKLLEHFFFNCNSFSINYRRWNW